MTQKENNISEIDFNNLLLKEYIYILCKVKGITAKQMCEDLGISYKAFKAHISKSISGKRLKLIIDYLDGDFTLAFGLPLNK